MLEVRSWFTLKGNQHGTNVLGTWRWNSLDAPMSNPDMISCPNVLDYLAPKLCRTRFFIPELAFPRLFPQQQMPCKWHGWQCTSLSRNDFFNPKGPKIVRDGGSVLYVFCSVYKCKERAKEFTDEDSYTFRGYDPMLLTMLPASVRDSLGVVLSNKQGLSVGTFNQLERSILHGSNFSAEASKLDESLKDTYFHQILQYYSAMAHEAQHRQQLNIAEATAGRNLKKPAQAPSFDEVVSTRAGLSDKYLRNLFCLEQKQKALFFDAHMGMLPSSILKGDKSYKVAKVVFKDGCRSFDSLYTVMNECNQIVAQYFTRTASMDEVETVLREIKERLESLGFDGIALFYTDNCCHETETIEASLGPGPKKLPTHSNYINNHDFSKLPQLTWSHPPSVLSKLSEVEDFADQLSDMVKSASDCMVFVGFDVAWCVDDPNQRAQTLQLSARGKTVVIQLYKALSPGVGCISLKNILSSPHIRLVGVSVVADINKVCKDWDGLVDKRNNNHIDLAVWARSIGVVRQGGKMQFLVGELLNKFLDKSDNVLCSDWSCSQLTEKQIMHAGIDSYVGPLLANQLEKLEKIHRIPQKEFAVGQVVRLFNQGGSGCVGIGKICEIDSPNKCKVKVLNVYRPSTKIWLAGKSEGKCLGDYSGANSRVRWQRNRMRLPSEQEEAVTEIVNELEDDHPMPEELPVSERWKLVRIKLDIFHAKKRLTKHLNELHGCYPYFCKLISEAFFITSPEDWNIVHKKVINKIRSKKEDKESTEGEIMEQITKQMKKNRTELNKECRRAVPDPKILEKRLTAVVVLFANVKDAKTGEKFFEKDAWEAYKSLLKHVRKGCLSDHPDINLYSKVDGKLKCARSTSNLEGYHSHVKRIIGQYASTSELCISILRQFNYRWNMDRFQDRSMHSPCYKNFYKQYLLEEIQMMTTDLFEQPIIPDHESSGDVIGTDRYEFYLSKDRADDQFCSNANNDKDYDDDHLPQVRAVSCFFESKIFDDNLSKFQTDGKVLTATEDHRSKHDGYNWSAFAEWWLEEVRQRLKKALEEGERLFDEDDEAIHVDAAPIMYRKTAALLKDHFQNQNQKKQLNSTATMNGPAKPGCLETVFAKVEGISETLEDGDTAAVSFHSIKNSHARLPIGGRDNVRPVGVTPIVAAAAPIATRQIINNLVANFQHAGTKHHAHSNANALAQKKAPKKKREGSKCSRCGGSKNGPSHDGGARTNSLAYCSEQKNWKPDGQILARYKYKE